MIAIFLPNGIGDILMLTPALRRLLDTRGRANVIVIVQGALHREILHKLLGYELKIIQRIDGGAFPNLRLWFRLYLMPLEVILAPLLSRKPLHFLYFFTLFKRVIVPSSFISKKHMGLMPATINLDEFDGHQVNYYVKFFAEYDSKIKQDFVTFNEYSYIQEIGGANQSMRTSKRVVIGISCGDKERHKIPTPLFFANFLNALAEVLSIEVLIIGSNSDLNKINYLRSKLNPKILNEVLIEMPLDTLLGRISCCDLGVSGTTGQGHMMALARLPMLVFAGVTNPFQSGPYVSRGAMLLHKYACGPCYQETFRIGCGTIDCMATLNIGDAVNLANKLLSNSSFGFNWLLEPVEIHTKPLAFIKAFHEQLDKF